MAKVHELAPGVWLFHCPGCGYDHPFHTDPAQHPTRQSWAFNGDRERPTITPSLLVFKERPDLRCHSFIRNGTIQFLNDCWHTLRGQTVELPEWG